MKLAVDAAQILPVNVGVNLRRRNVRVTKHLLDGAQIRPALEQVGGKGMSQRMRRHNLGDSGYLDVFPKNLPRPHARKRVAAGIEKKHSLPFPALDGRT